MSDPEPHHITRNHYAGFGMIVNIFAELETLLDEIIVVILKEEAATAAPLLSLLSNKSKRDYIVAIAKEGNVPEYAIDGLERLLRRIAKASTIRNYVAHWGWVKGQRKDAIKPLFISARATLRLLGLDHNEREWTASELVKEAEKMQQIGRDLLTFMNEYGLRWDIASKTSFTNSPKQ